MVTESHNLRHLFLQIAPITRQLCLPVLHQAALRVIDRIATENEQLLDSPVIYVCRQLQNIDRSRIARNLVDDQGLAEIFERSVYCINQQLHSDRLI